MQIIVSRKTRNSGKDRITSDDVARAVREFREKGGMVKTLPPENVTMPNYVNGKDLDAFERVGGFHEVFNDVTWELDTVESAS